MAFILQLYQAALLHQLANWLCGDNHHWCMAGGYVANRVGQWTAHHDPRPPADMQVVQRGLFFFHEGEHAGVGRRAR